MAKTLDYQGYTIQSMPHYETFREKWQRRIFVSFDHHQGSDGVHIHPRSCT